MKNIILLTAVVSCAYLAGGEHVEGAQYSVGTRALSVAEHAEMQGLRARLSEADAQEEEILAEDYADHPGIKAASLLNTIHRSCACSVFFTSHPGALHQIVTPAPTGNFVGLEDGSCWTVHSWDAPKVMYWQPEDSVVVSPNHAFFSVYYYCLTNQRTGEAVQVNLLPGYHTTATHWIVAVDDFNDRIYLEDGSAWDVSLFDGGVIRNWCVWDTIIIGINDGWLSSTRPNILINAETLTYVKANCAY